MSTSTAADCTLRDKQVCRTCLRSENLAPIFTRVERHERYSMALYLSTGLQVKLGDGLPQLICSACIESMRVALEFRTLSQKSEKIMVRWIRKNKFSPSESRKNSKSATKTRQKKKEKELNLTTLDIPRDDNSHSDFFPSEITSFNSENSIQNDENSSDKFVCENDEFSFKKESVADTFKRSESTNMYKRFRELLDGPLGGSGPYECKACKKVLMKWNSFKQHAKIHLGFDFLCEQCGRTFINSNVLHRHCMTRHGAERTYCCKLCDYRAVGSDQLKQCGRTFINSNVLHRHCMTRHGAERSYCCKLCDHIAVGSDQLKVHVRREHTGDRPFVCDACGAGFRTRPHLIHHLAVHQTHRPIHCAQCPATFKSSQHLMCHTSKVHRAQCWRGECYVCGKTYTKLQYVRKHIAKYHGVPLAQQDPIRKVRVRGLEL